VAIEDKDRFTWIEQHDYVLQNSGAVTEVNDLSVVATLEKNIQAYKAVRRWGNGHPVVANLLIPAGAKVVVPRLGEAHRLSLTAFKANSAYVHSMVDFFTGEHVPQAFSTYDPDFAYYEKATVKPKGQFSTARGLYGPGIHFVLDLFTLRVMVR
jgi:hypothetical protein